VGLVRELLLDVECMIWLMGVAMAAIVVWAGLGVVGALRRMYLDQVEFERSMASDDDGH
jgi:hypothetical protein